MHDQPRRLRRVGAYAVLRTPQGRTALVRGSDRHPTPPRWSLPGGGVRHGEHPGAAVVRETWEETGIAVEVTGLRDAVADLMPLPHRGAVLHTVRLLYDVRAVDGDDWPQRLRPEQGGTSDLARVVPPAELPELPLLDFTAAALGLSGPGQGTLPPGAPAPAPGAVPAPTPVPGAADVPKGPEASLETVDPPRVQRTAAYVLVVVDGRVLLTRLARDGRWSLPGGGIDFGEYPEQALHRELYEETGLRPTEVRLLGVESAHSTGHAPDGRLEDYHAVRLLYTGRVGDGAEPVVQEVGGSTDAAAWVPLGELDHRPLTEVVRAALDRTG